VFNFYRPGYVPPGTQAAGAPLAPPEMQIVHDTTVAGYAKNNRDNNELGVGRLNVPNKRSDRTTDQYAEQALADRSGALLDHINTKLFYGAMPAGLKGEIQNAVDSIVIPALNRSGSNQTRVDSARRARVNAALFLSVISPEFQVQK
jgi:hypothetical protein